jgi:hypothetical protein
MRQPQWGIAPSWPANIGSKFRKRSPLFTSVLFNHYSTNATDGYLSA